MAAVRRTTEEGRIITTEEKRRRSSDNLSRGFLFRNGDVPPRGAVGNNNDGALMMKLPVALEEEAMSVVAAADAFSNSSSGSSSTKEEQLLVDQQQEETTTTTTTSVDKVSPSWQLSMRKSRTLSEHEKDNSSLSGHLGVPRVPPVAASLSPLTPLRWKSFRQEDVVDKEADKTYTLGKQAQKVGRDVVVLTNVDTYLPQEVVIEENLRHGVEVVGDQNVEKQPKANGGTIVARAEQHTLEQSGGADAAASGLERKPSTGDETSVTTIDFLRARLLAERAASKAAKEHVQQLAKKVTELEGKLEEEILLRNKAEAAKQEALLKLKMKSEEALRTETPTEVPDTEGTMNVVAKETQRGADDHKDLVEPSVPHQEEADTARVSHLIHGKSVLQTENGHEKKATAMNNSKSVQYTSTSNISDVRSDPYIELKPSHPVTNWQERRSAREERLRNMWQQITQEMTALAKNGSQEELPNWMAQLPAVLQGIIPKTINTTGLNLQNGGNDNSDAGTDTQISEVGTEHDRRITKNHNEQSSGATQERPSLPSTAKALQQEARGDLMVEANGSRMQIKVHEECSQVLGGDLQLKNPAKTDFEPKNVAELIERYEAQESVQRQWEQNYYTQQKLDRQKVGNSKKIRKEGHSSHTSSKAESPFSGPQKNSQQGILTETAEDAPHAAPLHDDLIHNHNAVNLPISSGNGKVNLQAPHINTLQAVSDSPHSVKLERVDTPVSGNRHLKATGGAEEAIPGQQESGLEQSIDPSVIIASTRFARSEGHGSSGRQLEKELDDLNYPRATSYERRFHEDVVSYSGREPPDVEEVHNPQWAYSPVRPSEDARRSSFSDYKSISSMLDTSIEGQGNGQLQVHKESRLSFSHASSNGGHFRADHSSGYLRDSERGREMYRRRREGISRDTILEGVNGSNWRPQADGIVWQGDEDLQYREKQKFREMGFPHKPDNESNGQRSGYPQHLQAEDNGGLPDATVPPRSNPPLSTGHLGWDSPKKVAHKSQASVGQASNKANDVLRALQIAKLNIQGSGVKKAIVTSPHTTLNGHSYTGGALVSSKGYGGDGAGQYLGSLTDAESQHRFMKPHVGVHGSPIVSLPSSASSSVYNSPGADIVSRDTRNTENTRTDSTTPAINGHSSFVDKMTIGQGIQFFFP